MKHQTKKNVPEETPSSEITLIGEYEFLPSKLGVSFEAISICASSTLAEHKKREFQYSRENEHFPINTCILFTNTMK